MGNNFFSEYQAGYKAGQTVDKHLPRLMICGHGRHGKDTACEMMKPWKFISSSMFIAEIAIYSKLKDLYKYKSVQQCYDDRHNHREEWYELIKAYNNQDLTRLSRKLYMEYDIYCGIRCSKEFLAVQDKGLFVLSIWIDASKRLPPESIDSCTVTKDICDIVIENNGTLEQFKEKMTRFKRCLLY